MLTRLSTLLGSWAAYWLVLAGIKLGPAVAAIFRATRAEGSSVNLSFGDQGFLLDVTQRGNTIYTGTTHLLPLALWVAVPPLLLWIVWVVLRQREQRGAATRTENVNSVR